MKRASLNLCEPFAPTRNPNETHNSRFRLHAQDAKEERQQAVGWPVGTGSQGANVSRGKGKVGQSERQIIMTIEYTKEQQERVSAKQHQIHQTTIEARNASERVLTLIHELDALHTQIATEYLRGRLKAEAKPS